jgi:hypothetical protein
VKTTVVVQPVALSTTCGYPRSSQATTCDKEGGFRQMAMSAIREQVDRSARGDHHCPLNLGQAHLNWPPEDTHAD